LGDRVDVEVKSVDYYRQQIDLIVVGGGSEAPEDEVIEAPIKVNANDESDLSDENSDENEEE